MSLETETREALALTIEALIELIDTIDPDWDLEDDGNGEAEVPEPSLATPEQINQDLLWHNRCGNDREMEIDTADDEPSLGSIHALNQIDAWQNAGNDREEEHDGAEPDVDDEPSYGATHSLNQERAWKAPSGWAAIVPEGEPSLAVPEQMNQGRAWAHPGNRRELEEEHDGCEPEEDCDPGSDNEVQPVDHQALDPLRHANGEARKALADLLERLNSPSRRSAQRMTLSGNLRNS